MGACKRVHGCILVERVAYLYYFRSSDKHVWGVLEEGRRERGREGGRETDAHWGKWLCTIYRWSSGLVSMVTAYLYHEGKVGYGRGIDSSTWGQRSNRSTGFEHHARSNLIRACNLKNIQTTQKYPNHSYFRGQSYHRNTQELGKGLE